MLIKALKAKIHRAIVTGADLHYEGSIGIDLDMLQASGIYEGEAVHVWNIDTGARFETYAIALEAGSREIVVNGAAARMVHRGDKIIIVSFCWLEQASMKTFNPVVVLVDDAGEYTVK